MGKSKSGNKVNKYVKGKKKEEIREATLSLCKKILKHLSEWR